MASMMTTGSVRGKCSASQAEAGARIAGLGHFGLAAAHGAKVVARVPIEQGPRLRDDFGAAIAQLHRGGAGIDDLAAEIADQFGAAAAAAKRGASPSRSGARPRNTLTALCGTSER